MLLCKWFSIGTLLFANRSGNQKNYMLFRSINHFCNDNVCSDLFQIILIISLLIILVPIVAGRWPLAKKSKQNINPFSSSFKLNLRFVSIWYKRRIRDNKLEDWVTFEHYRCTSILLSLRTIEIVSNTTQCKSFSET